MNKMAMIRAEVEYTQFNRHRENEYAIVANFHFPAEPGHSAKTVTSQPVQQEWRIEVLHCLLYCRTVHESLQGDKRRAAGNLNSLFAKGLTMKKIISAICVLYCLTGCSEGDVEEFVFRETLKYNLADVCGKEDKGCISAVDSQTKSCMEKSNWRKFLNSKDDKEESIRFKTEFYACIVDPQGKPYFVPKT